MTTLNCWIKSHVIELFTSGIDFAQLLECVICKPRIMFYWMYFTFFKLIWQTFAPGQNHGWAWKYESCTMYYLILLSLWIRIFNNDQFTGIRCIPCPPPHTHRGTTHQDHVTTQATLQHQLNIISENNNVHGPGV